MYGVLPLGLLLGLPVLAAGNGCTATQIQNDLLPSHATPSSCWTVIVVNRQKIVYDITKLVSNHEGGRRVIEQMCGRDGSIGFWCVHGMEDLQESIDDGDATEICRTAASARRLDSLDSDSDRRLAAWDETDEDDDEGIRNSCAAGGSLPSAPATQILASEVANHKTSDDCWTSMTQGTTKIVMDITNYMTLHPGGKAYILSMCGKDSTAAFQVYHPLTYVTEAVRHGYVILKGQLSGTYPVITTTTVTLAPGVTTTTGPSSSPQTKVTAAILGQHATASDCWGRIGSWVVDMTSLLSSHPAGSSMLICGADVTASFRSIHADSYISRMPVVGTWDDTVIRRPAPTPAPAPAPVTAAPTPAPAPAPPPQIVGGQTSILNPQVPSESQELVSLEAIAVHNQKADCWVALRCKVYDMTPFIPLHTADKYASAGNGAIEKLCGSDATAGFEAVHPISYIDVSVSMGAVSQGSLAGCGSAASNTQTTQATQTTQTTQAPTSTAAPATTPPDLVPVNATLWYDLRFPNLVASSQDLTSVQTETSLSVAIAHTMHQQGLSNVRCLVTSLTPGSIQARVGLFMTDVGQLENARQFGRNHFTKVSWLNDSPTVQGTPTLDVGYATSTASTAGTAGTAGTGTSFPVYTINQVRDHNSNVDCWMAIHGKVYSFMGAGGAHPAGNFLSLGLCGVEASATFDLHHPLSYLGISALKKIGGAQVGTLSSASAEDAGRVYPRPSPVQVLPNIQVTLSGGSTDFLQKHNLGRDCWMALHGDVYDATSMLGQHDGGRANVEALCGLDATASFDCIHGMGEIQEAIQDYGISKVGTTNVVLGQGCTFQLQAGMLPDRQIAWAELAMHSTTQDCWIILGSQGIVWDVTAYLPKHTGGASSVGMHCGGDATGAFDKNHKVGYLTTIAQKGGFPQGVISGEPPALDSGSVQLNPLQMSEVQKHNIAADCWVAVHGYVMDITGYLDRHSGGRQSLVTLCGKDGTASFDSVSHPTSYITMMVQKRFATMKGCVGSCTTNGATVTSGSGIGTSPELTGPKATVPARECRADEPTPPAVTVTNAELQSHSTATDCWMVLGCGVYDISSYKHSGGNIVHSWCGKDGTTSFVGKHPWSYLQVMLGMSATLIGKYSGTPIGSSVGRQNPISLAEIGRHNTPKDCWSCIHGTVYELHFYLPDHDAGSAVIEPMCGEDATAYFAMAHSMEALGGLPKKGSCDNRAEQAFTEQNILDGAALVSYIILPMFFNEVILAATSPAAQDRLLRRPMAKPFKSKCLGNFLNSYVEMPLGVFFMVVWFLIVTAVLSVFWSIHYNEYYLPDFVLAGWVGRMTVYMISMATYLGTRRWSLAWVFYKISYEKTLKAHYVIGNVASIFMLVHGGMYMASFGPRNLPEHQVTTAYLLLGCILVVFPFTINNFRVHYYFVFKVTHFIAPAITILGTLHILSLHVDGELGRGFWVALVWIASASLFWLGDFIYSRYDVLLRPTVVIGTPRLLPADGGPAHICVKLRKLRATLFPGAWMSVGCREAFSPLSHPFTAIVRKCGGLDREYAEVEFIFKVNEGRTWTQRLSNAIAKLSPKQPMKFFMIGPYGGGLGSLDPMKVIIFVVGGVGVTPAASLAPYLVKRGKDVYVIWSCRSASLIQHVAVEYFSNACHSYFDRQPDHRHIHYSGKGSEGHVFPPFVKTGRPDVAGVLQKAAKSAMSQDIFDLGVFVCGPNALVESTLMAADEFNADKTNAHIHVHAESFQM